MPLSRFFLFLLLSAADAPQGCWIRDVAAPTESTAWLLCEQGKVLVTENRGETWSARGVGGGGQFRGLNFSDPEHAAIVGGDGLILTTADAGRTWIRALSGTASDLTDVQFVGPRGCVVGYDGVILHSPDAGKTWQRQWNYLANSLEAVDFLDANAGWAVGWASTVLHTTDGGQFWRTVQIPDIAGTLSAVRFRDAGRGWITGMFGLILRTKDGGKTWDQQRSGVSSWLTSLAFTPEGRGLIIAEEDLLVSDDGGETWRSADIRAPGALRRIAIGGKRVWLAGPQTVLTSADGGRSWTDVSPFRPAER